MNKKNLFPVLAFTYMVLTLINIIMIILYGIATEINIVPHLMLRLGIPPALIGLVYASLNLRHFGKEESYDWPQIHFMGSVIVLFIGLFALLIIFGQ